MQIADDQTGDLISLTDDNGNPLYAIYLEIAWSHSGGSYGGSTVSSWYDDCGDQVILADLNNYITIPDTGTIQIEIPYTIMQSLSGGLTYDVYLRIVDAANTDARQILIGRLPVAHGGRRQ